MLFPTLISLLEMFQPFLIISDFFNPENKEYEKFCLRNEDFISTMKEKIRKVTITVRKNFKGLFLGTRKINLIHGNMLISRLGFIICFEILTGLI